MRVYTIIIQGAGRYIRITRYFTSAREADELSLSLYRFGESARVIPGVAA